MRPFATNGSLSSIKSSCSKLWITLTCLRGVVEATPDLTFSRFLNGLCNQYPVTSWVTSCHKARKSSLCFNWSGVNLSLNCSQRKRSAWPRGGLCWEHQPDICISLRHRRASKAAGGGCTEKTKHNITTSGKKRCLYWNRNMCYNQASVLYRDRLRTVWGCLCVIWSRYHGYLLECHS